MTANATSIGTLEIEGVLAPPSIASTPQDDYNPTGLRETWLLRLSLDQTTVITGIVSPSTRKMLRIENDDAVFPIILAPEGGGSSASNRFKLAGTISAVIMPGGGLDLYYETSNQRWQVLNAADGLPKAVEDLSDLTDIAQNATASLPSRVFVRDEGLYELDPHISGLTTDGDLVVSTSNVGRWVKIAGAEPGEKFEISERQVLTGGAAATTIVPFVTRDADRAYSIEVQATVRDVTNGDSGAWRLFGAFERTAGAVAQIGATEKVARLEAGLTTADLDFAISGTSIQIQGTPEADNDCRFRVFARVVEDRA